MCIRDSINAEYMGGIKVEVVHNASIINAVGCCGLQVYRFGEIISIPFFTEKGDPIVFYNKILQNRKSNLHTLLLLDIKVKERTDENILKNKKIYEPPRFMSCKVAVEQLIEAEENLKGQAFTKETKCFGLARIGFPNQLIVSGKLADFLSIDMGEPIHSFVICAEELHVIEEDMYNFYKLKKQI
eukprot:TRINITY_DN24659_c0_g1_i1.p3 TRINITY_DN24659_c0_g1~~TRINITY_DN24659_c0_g1_i1.p3  ORF type:complete len:185 (-),score=39.55 TRINITY_DN24659_c0_g1_i1:99-653(-)